MFGLLKNLFGKKDPEPPKDAGARPQPPPATSSASQPTAKPASPAPASTFQPIPVPQGPRLSLGLKHIVAKLPPSIASVQTQKLPADAKFSVPVSKVMDQLPFGCVRVSFAELFSWSTPNALTFCAGQEEALIDLPLSEVLKQLNDGQLSRRPNQKQVEVPDEIENLFGPKGKPVRPVTPAPKAPAATPAPSPKERPPEPPSRGPLPLAPKEVSTAKPPLSPPPPAAPPAPAVRPAEQVAPAPAPITTPAPAPVPTPPPVPEAPLKPSFSLPSPESLRPTASAKAPEKPLPPTPKPASAPIVAPVPEKRVEPTTPNNIQVPLASILAAGSSALKGLFEGLDPASFKVVLNASEAEAALKKGKFLLPGNKLASQIVPPIPAAAAAKFSAEPVEIPLAAVVPVFMASSRPSAPQKRLAAVESIPELFPTRKASATAPAPPSASEPAPTSGAAAASPPQVVKTEAPASLAQPPVKKPATAEEIVAALVRFKEVQGALVTMDDGFVVAAQLPVGFNTEFIAAFVPGAYQRGVELLKALNFAETDQIQLQHEGVQMHIVPAKTLYLLVFSQPGASISRALLSEHADLLAKCATSN